MKVAFVILYLVLLKKLENSFASLTLHPMDKLPQIAPCFNLEPGRFWISIEEFHGRVEEISRDLERIKAFSSFTINNYRKIRERRFMSGDVRISSELLTNFLGKEFVDQKKMFQTVCNQFQFEFLLMYDLSRE